MSFRNEILVSVKKRVLFTLHALDQMNKPERLITQDEVKKVVLRGEIIEDYPEDPRGHSCLMLGYGDMTRPLHVVCSPKADSLAVITAYVPSIGEWSEDFRKRRR